MKSSPRWLWAALALLVCGCGGEDVDRLGRIAAKASSKIQEMAGGPHGKLADGWQAVCNAVGDATPEARVAVRLHWDKQLVAADIQATSSGPGVVRLQGTVADASQQQRAQEIAESTQGVEKVVNDLAVGAP